MADVQSAKMEAEEGLSGAPLVGVCLVLGWSLVTGHWLGDCEDR